MTHHITRYHFYHRPGEVKEDGLNALIKDEKFNANLISDGCHTFGELYEHRIMLFIALCRMIILNPLYQKELTVWRSTVLSDGSSSDGLFLLGLNTDPGKQVTYHLPLSKWDATWFADTLPQAPEYDGHNSDDILHRLSQKVLI